jgi:hypothetical protein
MLHHPHVFCNHARFCRIHTAGSSGAGQTWPRLIPCRCMLARYGWWVCHAAQRRASALTLFLHVSTHCVLDLSPQVTPETHHHPRTCMGIRQYLAHAAYDAWATQHAIRQAAISARTSHACSLAQRCTALLQATPAVWEAAQRARLGVAGIAALTCLLAVQVAVDETRKVHAYLPACAIGR